MRIPVFALVVLINTGVMAAPPMTPSDAFSLGMGDGSSGAAGVAAGITGSNAAANVPDYNTTNANSSYFGGGNGNPRTFGSARVLDCATTVYTTPRDQAECAAVNQIAGDRNSRPVTPFSPTDPMLTTGKSIANDPTTVAGAFSSGYSACSTQTVTTPPVYETEYCVYEKKIEPVQCQKTLTVQVDIRQCNPGDVLYSYSTYKGDTISFICDPDPSKLRITGNLNGWCYWDYRGFTHLAFVSVEATPRILQKGGISYYTSPVCNSYVMTTDEYGNLVPVDNDSDGQPDCASWGSVVNGPISSMRPDQTLNDVLFGSYYRRGCMLEFKPSSCDLAAETCTYNLKFINQYNWDDNYYPDIIADLATPSMKTPQYHAETDIWDTAACDILNSRTAP